MLTSIGSSPKIAYATTSLPARTQENSANQSNKAQADPVTLSPLAKQLSNESDNWRTAPQDYPPGFPQQAKDTLQSIAQDPSVSFLDYAVLSFNMVKLPQVEGGNAGMAASADGNLPGNANVFASGNFDIKSHALNLMNQANTSILSGDFVAANQKQLSLLQRFL